MLFLDNSTVATNQLFISAALHHIGGQSPCATTKFIGIKVYYFTIVVSFCEWLPSHGNGGLFQCFVVFLELLLNDAVSFDVLGHTTIHTAHFTYCKVRIVHRWHTLGVTGPQQPAITANWSVRAQPTPIHGPCSPFMHVHCAL